MSILKGMTLLPHSVGEEISVSQWARKLACQMSS